MMGLISLIDFKYYFTHDSVLFWGISIATEQHNKATIAVEGIHRIVVCSLEIL